MSVSDVDFFSSAKFAVTKFREGYDQTEVDHFLDELIAAIQRQDPGTLNALPEQILNKRFSVTKFREGYDMDHVDVFLEEATLHFRALGQQAGAGAGTGEAQLASPYGVPAANQPRSAGLPFDGAFFAALNFGHTRMGGLDIVEVDKFVDHVKEVVWSNNPDAIRRLSDEAIAKEFPKAGFFVQGYAGTGVYDFLEEVNARASTY